MRVFAKRVVTGFGARCAVGVVAGLLLSLSACGSGGGQANTPTTVPTPPTATAQAADITLLFMGNSHTGVNNVPGLVATMVQAARPGKTANAVEAPGWMFLEERLNDPATRTLLSSQPWSAVILQAQKYSSSGQFTYSTAEAEELVRLARRQGAIPVMFPEWPRRGIAETQRIFDLHVSIAAKEPACVPPIPQAWDLAAAREPSITLYDPDGNHSAPAGAFLTGLVIFSTLTNQSPSALPTIPSASIDANTQAKLRAIATEAVQSISPRLRCPADRAL